jgi:hypothetical protein
MIWLVPKLQNLVILPTLCPWITIDYHEHTRMATHLSFIIFDNLAYARIAEPGHLANIMPLAYN